MSTCSCTDLIHIWFIAEYSDSFDGAILSYLLDFLLVGVERVTADLVASVKQADLVWGGGRERGEDGGGWT